MKIKYETTQTAKIEDLPRGEFFKRLVKGQPTSKVFTKEGFDRSEKKYECNDESDISRSIYIKKGTLVQVGFCY